MNSSSEPGGDFLPVACLACHGERLPAPAVPPIVLRVRGLHRVPHRAGEIGLVVDQSGHGGDDPARHDLADEHRPAPPAFRAAHLPTHVEAQVDLLEIRVEGKAESEHARMQEQESDHADVGPTLESIQLRSRRHEGKQHSRVRRVVDHRQLPPFRREEDRGGNGRILRFRGFHFVEATRPRAMPRRGAVPTGLPRSSPTRADMLRARRHARVPR